MTLRTKTKLSGDVFIREDLTRPYDAESVAIVNAGAANMILPPGTPMEGVAPATTAEVGTGTGITSFVLNPTTIPPTTTLSVAVLARGVGIVVNYDELPPTDQVGSAFVEAEIKAAYTGLDFVVRDEPASVEVQIK